MKLSLLSLTQMFPSRSTRIPCASLYCSPQDFTNVPSGLNSRKGGTVRLKIRMLPSALVATCGAPPMVIPAGSFSHEDNTSHPVFTGACSSAIVAPRTVAARNASRDFMSPPSTSPQNHTARIDPLRAAVGWRLRERISTPHSFDFESLTASHECDEERRRETTERLRH